MSPVGGAHVARTVSSIAVLLFVCGTPAVAQGSGDASDLALHGYDPVAYYTGGYSAMGVAEKKKVDIDL